MIFSRVAIIGLGLIGWSLARAIREQMPDVIVSASDSSEQVRGFAYAQSLVHRVESSSALAAAGAELVILAVPIPGLADAAREIVPELSPGAVVTDVASVKMPLIERVAPLLPPYVFLVPGHPIAGSEKGGIEAARGDLFEGRRVVLTPEDPHLEVVERLAAFWRQLGARIDYMPPDLHDRIYAAVSHLPQFLSFAYNILLQENEVILQEGDVLRRFLRLTKSPRLLWEGIFAANRINIDKMLDDYLQVLHQIIGELGEGEDQASTLPDPQILYGEWVPRIAASCLVAVAVQLEDELGVPVRRYAGSGFEDYTAPLTISPESHMEAISTHASAVRRALAHWASILRAQRSQF